MIAWSDTLFKSIGGLLVLLGIVVALSGWFIFPGCEMHGLFTETKAGAKLPMPCGYTARAETGIGALIVVAGGIASWTKYTGNKTGSRCIQLACGVLVILFPTVIIGMCRLADHPCRQLPFPHSRSSASP